MTPDRDGQSVPRSFADDAETLIAENQRLLKAVAARDAFLSVAAHELRNPMTPILGRITLLRRAVARGAAQPEDIASALEKIEGLMTRYVDRATTLLDLSRADAAPVVIERQIVDVARIVADAAESFRPAARHAGASLDVHAPAGPILAIGHPQALEQVLEHLLSNAVKYGAGTPVAVSITPDRLQRLVRIAVSDRGPGIAVEDQERIFERYERVDRPDAQVEGFGVGLWVVRRLCHAMDASVVLVSRPGQGATFTVCLPLAHDEEHP